MVMLGAGKGQWLVGSVGSGHRGFVQKWVSLLCGGNIYSTLHMALEGKCYWVVWGGSLFCLWVCICACCGGCVVHMLIVGHCFWCNVCAPVTVVWGSASSDLCTLVCRCCTLMSICRSFMRGRGGYGCGMWFGELCSCVAIFVVQNHPTI